MQCWNENDVLTGLNGGDKNITLEERGDGITTGTKNGCWIWYRYKHWKWYSSNLTSNKVVGTVIEFI